jgi:hypothetical protein
MDALKNGRDGVTHGGQPLRPGEVVEVRSAAEILATLDGGASLDAMPFMPEMLKHVGKRFTVTRRVEKICNNADVECSPIRRMHSTVHLDDLRCDGSAHDGCQLGCRFYWKEEWLRRVDGEPVGAQADGGGGGAAQLEAVSRRATRTTRELEGEQVETYRCQGTDAIIASEALHKLDPRQFIREVTAGNFGPVQLVSALGRTAWSKFLRILRLRRMLPLTLPPPGTPVEAREPIGLRPGDLVQVRSREEVAPTLNQHGRNRGLSFSPEMVRYCGGTFRVRDRVERLIDEKTGKMIEISRDCLILDGAICPGEGGAGLFLFCPRGTFPFWREAWLRRIDEQNEGR